MATYKLKRKNFGLFSPFAKTAANWTAAKGAFKAGENVKGFKNLASTMGRGSIGLGKGLSVAAAGTAALGAGTFLAAENKANS